MAKSADVLVIGAGNAGLAAAATTAKMGLSTLLLERHNLPGGSATSFRRGRFEFEPSLHEMAGYGPQQQPGDVREFFEWLGVKADMLPVKDAFRTIVTGPKGYDVTMPVGIESFVGKMEKEVPGSAVSTANFFKLAGDVGRALGYLSKGKPDPQVLQAEHLNFMKVANLPVSAVLDELGMPEKARGILLTYWPYMGTPGSQFSFVMYALLVYRYISMGAYIPKNRSHELSLAIEQVIRDNGGEIRYNTKVGKIIMKDGRCLGAVTEDGSEIRAKAVIANFFPSRAFTAGMMDEAEIPVAEIKRANARRIGMSAFCVYLGLGKSPQELGIKDYSVFLADTPDSEELFRGMHTFDNNSFSIMNCLNLDNPGCSPEGTSLLWSTQLFAPGVWDDVKPRDYKALKNRMARKVIDQYEQATGIKISDCIEEISVATPLTFARYLDSPQGSIYGYHSASWDSMLPRIMASAAEQSVKGLYFAGGHGMRTLGYSSTYINGRQSGQTAATDIKEGR